MSSIVSALDKHFQPKQFGENNHVEYGWSEEPDQLVTQFFFQLVRTKDSSDLEKKLRHMLQRLDPTSEHFSILYKIIAQTRDIVAGKGEYELAYMQLRVWWDYYPALAMNAFSLFVNSQVNPLNHQYGSWKDVKYMCEHLRKNSQQGEEHPFIQEIIEFTACELIMEFQKWQGDKENYKPGLIGRWIPREKSKKFGWVFKKLASKIFPAFTVTPQGGWKNENQKKNAGIKQMIHLKKMIVLLSKETDTAQIKMCAKQWDQLNFNHITSLTLRKQKNAILNKTKKGEKRSEDEDRVKCAENYKEHLLRAKSGDKTAKVHGKRCTVGELVKDALKVDDSGDEYDTINLQWESNKSNNKGLEGKPIVTMVDTSGSMEADECTPLYNAIGLGIRTSEICHPAFRNRMLTFDARPVWIRTTDDMTFVEKAKKVRHSSWGCNTDFHLAIDMIIDALVTENVDPRTVRDMVFACFSDMQFDCQYHNIGIFDSAAEVIARKFAEAGLRTTWKRPYESPHFLFWNLRKTTGFPATTFSQNITFLSGYNSVLLNILCEKGIEALRDVTPYLQLKNIVE